MRSLEVSLIALRMIATSITTYSLVGVEPDLNAIARQLAGEVDRVYGIKVFDVGIPLIVELRDRVLIVHYEGRVAEAELGTNS